MNKKQTDMEWAKSFFNNYPNGEQFTFNNLGVFVQGKFSEPHILGFYVYSLSTGKKLGHITGATNKDNLMAILEEHYPLGA